MRVEVYRNMKGKWFWRKKASNGRTVADGSQGYRSKAACLKGYAASQRPAKIVCE